MIEGLKPYPKMKDSGVPWLGQVPEHWEIRKLRQVLDRVTERNRPDLPLLSVVRERGVILRDINSSDENHNFIPDDLSNYKVVRCGQFAMNKMKAWQGSYGISRHEGIVSPAYFVFDVAGVDGHFFHRAIRSRAYVPSFTQASDGVRVGQWDLSIPRMREIEFVCPEPSERSAIVRFIDHADRQIRRAIRSKQKLIALLEEQKQVIIHRSVTRGIDPNAALKYSGHEYIGDVPSHWDLIPNRAFLRLKKEVVGSRSADYVLLSLTKRGIIERDIENPEGKFPTSFETYQVIEPGDFVFCLFDIDETPRAVGLSSLHGMITGAYTRFACESSIADWIYLFYLAMDNGKRLKPLYTALRKVITKSRFLGAKLPVPPPEERTRLIADVEHATRSATEASSRAQLEINLLKEFHTRLISDVVTGKLDVREAAARLPADSIEGDELLDDTDADIENVDGSYAEGEGDDSEVDN